MGRRGLERASAAALWFDSARRLRPPKHGRPRIVPFNKRVYGFSKSKVDAIVQCRLIKSSTYGLRIYNRNKWATNPCQPLLALAVCCHGVGETSLQHEDLYSTRALDARRHVDSFCSFREAFCEQRTRVDVGLASAVMPVGKLSKGEGG